MVPQGSSRKPLKTDAAQRLQRRSGVQEVYNMGAQGNSEASSSDFTDPPRVTLKVKQAVFSLHSFTAASK